MTRWAGDSIYNPIFVRNIEKIPTRFNTGEVIYGKGPYGGIDISQKTEVFMTVNPVQAPPEIRELCIQKEIYVEREDLKEVFASAQQSPEGTIFKVKIVNVFLGMSQNQIDKDTEDAFETSGIDDPKFYVGYRRTFYLKVQMIGEAEKQILKPVLRRRVIDIEDTTDAVLSGDYLQPVAFVKFQYPNGVVKYANVVSGSTADNLNYLSPEELLEGISSEQAEQEEVVLWKNLDENTQDFSDIDVDLIGEEILDYEKARLFLLSTYGANINTIPEGGGLGNPFVLRWEWYGGVESGKREKRAIYIDKGKVERGSTIKDSLYYVVEWF